MSARIGRNEPCPCGSGRKHKRCCAGRAVAAAPPTLDDVREAVAEVLTLAQGLRDRTDDNAMSWCERAFARLEYPDVLWDSAHVPTVGVALALTAANAERLSVAAAASRVGTRQPSRLASALWAGIVAAPPRVWLVRGSDVLIALDRPSELREVAFVLDLTAEGAPAPRGNFWGWCVEAPAGLRFGIRVVPLEPTDFDEALDILESLVDDDIERGVPDPVWRSAAGRILESFLWADPDLAYAIGLGDDDDDWDDHEDWDQDEDDDWDDDEDQDDDDAWDDDDWEADDVESWTPDQRVNGGELIARTVVSSCVRPGAAIRGLASERAEERRRALATAREEAFRSVRWLLRCGAKDHETLVPLDALAARLGMGSKGPAGDASLDQLVAHPIALLAPDPAALGLHDVAPDAPIRFALRLAEGSVRESIQAELGQFRRERRFAAILRAAFESHGTSRGLRYATLRLGLDELFDALPRDTPLAAIGLARGVVSRFSRALGLEGSAVPTVALLPDGYSLWELPGFGEKSQDALVEALHRHLETWRWSRAGLDPSAPARAPAADEAAASGLKAGLAKLDDLFG